MTSHKSAAGPGAPKSESFEPTRTEPLLREAADCTPAPVWMTNSDGAMVFANRAFEEQAGQPASVLMGGGWINFIHPDDLEAVRQKRAAAWAAGHVAYTYESRFLRHDGAWRWWEVSSRPRIDAEGRFQGYVGMAIDRTEERATREALLESERRYRAVVEDQSDLICRFRADGEILFVNGAYARARGTTAEALQGANLWSFVAEQDREAVRALLATLTPLSPEVRIENRVETVAGQRWMIWTNRALAFDSEGRWTEAQSTGVDIQDRRQAEEQRKLLLDELNHRVKNTLAVVQGIASQSFRAVDLHAFRAFEGRIMALANAHNLLTRTQWDATPLHVLIAEVAHVGASEGRIVASGPPVLLKPQRAVSLAMALHELCTNALKYGALSSSDGVVEVTWRVAGGPRRRLEFEWRERGGPPVAPPTTRGYGSKLIERALAHDLAAEVTLAFEPSGVVCAIRGPLD